MIPLTNRADNHKNIEYSIMSSLDSRKVYPACDMVLLRPRLHETGTKSIWDDLVSVIVLFIIDVYMRPG
jgi:hypothetical protein